MYMHIQKVFSTCTIFCVGLPDEIPIFKYEGKLSVTQSPQEQEGDAADSSGEVLMGDTSAAIGLTPGSHAGDTSTAANSSVAETSSMMAIDTDTDENSFTL